MPKPDVHQIIEDHLKANGFDGLWNPNGECACRVGDLFPCEAEGVERCCPGYLASCDCGEHDWHIQDSKPAPEPQPE